MTGNYSNELNLCPILLVIQLSPTHTFGKSCRAFLVYPGGKKGKFNKNDTNYTASFLEDVFEWPKTLTSIVDSTNHPDQFLLKRF